MNVSNIILKSIHPFLCIFILFANTGYIFCVPADLPITSNEKQRVIICTDISGEPDDQQSLVRFLTYANEFEIEGIIASTSCWKKNNPDTSAILNVIKAYQSVLPNLLLHSSDYPSAEYLKSVTKKGVDGFAMKAAADQLDNEGINHIISVIDKDVNHPVWILSWGGSNNLGGAVMKVKNSRTEEEALAFASKIRGFEIALQDDGQAYIAHHYPETKLISSKLQWKGMSKTTPTFGAWSESWGGNNAIFTHEWIKNNIQTNHGKLGAHYPSAVYLWEGDSPSLLYLINNGLGNPEHPEYGSWGGRFERVKKTNMITGTGNTEVDPELKKHEQYKLYSDAADTWTYNTETYENNIYAPLFRWRSAYQRDFQARMDWCTKSYEEANHPPEPKFEGNLIQTLKGDTQIVLSALGSVDPDGDALSYKWIYYQEAGNYDDIVSIQYSDSIYAVLTTPIVYIPTTIHIILQVTDKGIPALSRYKRILIHILTSPPPPKPDEPTNLVVLSQSSNSVNLQWEDNSDNEVGFKIERKDSLFSNFFVIDSVKKNVTSFLNSNVSAATTYVYRIASYNFGGLSEYSNAADATTSSTNTLPWDFAAFDNENLNFEGHKEIRYGANGSFITIISTDTIGCNQISFGTDPAPGELKHCDLRDILPSTIEKYKNGSTGLHCLVLPNPCINGTINLDFDKNFSGEIKIYTINGKLISCYPFEQKQSIKLSTNLKSGPYILQLQSGQEKSFLKIIIKNNHTRTN